MSLLPDVQTSIRSTLREKGINFATVDLRHLENQLWETFDIGIGPTVVVFIDGRPAIRRDAVSGRSLSAEVLDNIVQQIGVGRVAHT